MVVDIVIPIWLLELLRAGRSWGGEERGHRRTVGDPKRWQGEVTKEREKIGWSNGRVRV